LNTTNKGRRLGKRREEDNFPASHGNKRESELTLPYGYPKKRGIEGKGEEKEEKRER
jgi:hypothetical protein